MRRIPLSGVKGAGLFALVDDSDYETAMAAGPWYLSTDGYAQRNVLVGEGRGRHTTERLHQLLVGSRFDHVDRQKLNNQRSNLRPATQAENNQNTCGRGSSPYRGVSWSKRDGKWAARARLNGKLHWLGYFDDEAEAAAVAAAWRQAHMPFSHECGARGTEEQDRDAYQARVRSLRAGMVPS